MIDSNLLLILGNIGSLLAGMAAIIVVSQNSRSFLGLGENPHLKQLNGKLRPHIPFQNYGNSVAKNAECKIHFSCGEEVESINIKLAKTSYPKVRFFYDGDVTFPQGKPLRILIELSWTGMFFYRKKYKERLIWNGNINDLNLYLDTKYEDKP
jgi:hypothetical protein